MLNILIISDYFREDISSMFCNIEKISNVLYLYYNSKKNELFNKSLAKPKNNVVFWDDYKDAFILLERVKPNKIIFITYETYKEIALNISAKQIGIKTYFLDHGIRKFIVKENTKTSYITNKILLYLLLQKNRFFYNTYKKSSLSNKVLLFDFFKKRRLNDINNTICNIDKTILPSNLIVFSNRTYSFFKGRGDKYESVKYIGIPFFDKYWGIREEGQDDDVIYIEQPFLEQGSLFNVNYEKWYNHIVEILGNIPSEKLFIKPHPLSDIKKWGVFGKKVEVLKEEDFFKKIHKRNIIIGYWSTILIPLIAISHLNVVLISFFPEHNASDLFKNVSCISFIDKVDVLKNDIPNKIVTSNFINEWMYKFDGKSRNRLTEFLLDEYC